MADEREDAAKPAPDAADSSKIQSGGREANGAQPLNAAPANAGAQRYPAANQDAAQSSAEPRSFDPSADAPTPRQGAGDGSAPASGWDGFTGPGGDPVEGKR